MARYVFLSLVVAVAVAMPVSTWALEYRLPPSDIDVVGEIKRVRVQADESLVSLAYRHGIGYREMRLANPGVDMWVPDGGQRVTIPSRFVLPDTPREGIVLNVAEMRLYYYPERKNGQPRTVETYPISVGRRDWATPVGKTTIVEKTKNPTWKPPQSIREEARAAGRELPAVVEAGPDNPLGQYKMRLGMPGYLIHGTNKPQGIGMRVTHGCARMAPEDIESLFPRVDINTPVRIVNQPVKAGWVANELFVEVHPTLKEDEEKGIDRIGQAVEALSRRFDDGQGGTVDYERLNRASERPDGMPEAVTRDEGLAMPRASFSGEGG